MFFIRLGAGILTVLLMFIGCATLRTPGPLERSIFLDDNRAVFLLDPSVFPDQLDQTQFLEGYHGSDQYSAEVFVQADAQGITQLALTSFGTEIYRYRFTRDQFEFSSGFLPDRADPLYLVLDFQLAYYPAPILAPHLEAAGLTFEETRDESGTTRRILNQDQVLVLIQRRSGQLVFQNLKRNYGFRLSEGNSDAP